MNQNKLRKYADLLRELSESNQRSKSSSIAILFTITPKPYLPLDIPEEESECRKRVRYINKVKGHFDEQLLELANTLLNNNDKNTLQTLKIEPYDEVKEFLITLCAVFSSINETNQELIYLFDPEVNDFISFKNYQRNISNPDVYFKEKAVSMRQTAADLLYYLLPIVRGELAILELLAARGHTGALKELLRISPKYLGSSSVQKKILKNKLKMRYAPDEQFEPLKIKAKQLLAPLIWKGNKKAGRKASHWAIRLLYQNVFQFVSKARDSQTLAESELIDFCNKFGLLKKEADEILDLNQTLINITSTWILNSMDGQSPDFIPQNSIPDYCKVDSDKTIESILRRTDTLYKKHQEFFNLKHIKIYDVSLSNLVDMVDFASMQQEAFELMEHIKI